MNALGYRERALVQTKSVDRLSRDRIFMGDNRLRLNQYRFRLLVNVHVLPGSGSQKATT